MDPYNNSEYQWPDQMESHEMNERAPINYNQNTYMTNNERENSVESLNIDTMRAKGSEQNGRGRSCYNEVPKEGSYVTIWKYMEQIKSISAGQIQITLDYDFPYQILQFVTMDLDYSRFIAVAVRRYAHRLGHLPSAVLPNVRFVSKGFEQHQCHRQSVRVGGGIFKDRHI